MHRLGHLDRAGLPGRVAVAGSITKAIERAVHRAARSAVRSLAAAGAAAVILVAGAVPVAAHGETFFQLGADRIQPGGQVEIRADLGGGDAFHVTLIANVDGSSRDLGTIAATDEGHLQAYVTIPADVPAGDYLVEIAWDVTVVRAPLTVAGTPITDAGGDRPDQDEGFPAPASMAAGGVAPAPSFGVALRSQTPSTVAGRPDPVEALGILVAAGVAVIGVLGALRIARRRSPPSGPAG